MSGPSSIVGFGVEWVGVNGGCGVEDGEAVVFDFDVGLCAVGEGDGVRWVMSQCGGVVGDGEGGLVIEEGLIALVFEFEA